MNRPIPDWELELKTLLGERTYTRQLILFRTHQDHFSSFHAFLSVRFSKSYQRHSVWRRVGIGFALAGISALIPGIAFAVHDYRSTETDGSDEFFSFSGAFVAGSVLTMVGSLFIIWGTVQLIVSSVKEKRAKKVLHILGYTPRSGSRDNPR